MAHKRADLYPGTFWALRNCPKRKLSRFFVAGTPLLMTDSVGAQRAAPPPDENGNLSFPFEQRRTLRIYS